MSNNKREQMKNAEKVAGKTYDPSDYQSNDQTAKGMAITHEQVSDDYTEGTIDGKIDAINENDELVNKEGEDIPRKGYE